MNIPYYIEEKNLIAYSDLYPYLYFKNMIEGIRPNNQIKHLVIDEMQDYSLLQLSLIEQLFPCQKTICGDVHQSLVSYEADFLSTIQAVLPNARLVKFLTSYRSSFEIMTFAKQFITEKELIQPIERYGKK